MNLRSQSWPAKALLLIVLLAFNVFHVRPAQAHPDVDINIFFGALAPYGTWVNHGTYGRAWYPRGVSRGWRPYTDGHWDFTREYGWVWVSDWLWGWAPFHYGRWAWDDGYGWLWLPGRVWGPAWVFWRYGGGYAAWAPMPPNVIWRPGYGLNTRYFDYDRDLHRNGWVCVPEGRVHDRYVKRYQVDPRYNDRFLPRARNFVNLKNVGNIVVDQGVPVRQIEASSGKRVRVIPVREVDNIWERRRSGNQGVLTVIRPNIRAPGAGDIRREEELAQNISRQNELRRREQPRSGGRTEVNPPARQRKGTPAMPQPGAVRGRQTPAPRSLPPQQRPNSGSPQFQERQGPIRPQPSGEQQRWKEQQYRRNLQQQQIDRRRRQAEQSGRVRQEQLRQQQQQFRMPMQRMFQEQQKQPQRRPIERQQRESRPNRYPYQRGGGGAQRLRSQPTAPQQTRPYAPGRSRGQSGFSR